MTSVKLKLKFGYEHFVSMIIRIEDLIGKSMLIVGDVGRGKTALTCKIIELLLKLGFRNKITILDFAPNIIRVGGITAGGKLLNFGLEIDCLSYLTNDFYAPRLTGKHANDVIELARANRVRCEELLLKYLIDPTPVLVINDVTIYFQVGDLGLLTDALNVADTFIANGYYGAALADDRGSGISFNEKFMIEMLMELVDEVIDLNKVVIEAVISARLS